MLQKLREKLGICAHTILDSQLLYVEDTHNDARFKDHPLCVGKGLRFYAGVPLTTKAGFNIGTLVVADIKPNTLSIVQRDTLVCLSERLMILLGHRKSNLNSVQVRNQERLCSTRSSKSDYLS